MMAVDLHSSELLIPCQDNHFDDDDSVSLQNRSNRDRFFGSSESGSELSCSPIDSSDHLSSSFFTESSEGEEDEEEEDEDYLIGELTRQMAQYMLQDEDKHEKSSPMVGESENMKKNEETARNNHGVELNKALIDEKIRAIQFYKMKQQQALQQMQQKARVKHYQAPWYTLQQVQQRQTGSRAVYLNGSGSRDGSSGTGVFLPRGAGTPCKSRKKQGCATVLIPARVVHALNVHFEKTGVPPRFNTTGSNAEVSTNGRHSTNSPQKDRSGAAEPARNHHEETSLCLPQEWTY